MLRKKTHDCLDRGLICTVIVFGLNRAYQSSYCIDAFVAFDGIWQSHVAIESPFSFIERNGFVAVLDYLPCIKQFEFPFLKILDHKLTNSDANLTCQKPASDRCSRRHIALQIFDNLMNCDNVPIFRVRLEL
jgi:hypothetical protein